MQIVDISPLRELKNFNRQRALRTIGAVFHNLATVKAAVLHR